MTPAFLVGVRCDRCSRLLLVNEVPGESPEAPEVVAGYDNADAAQRAAERAGWIDGTCPACLPVN